MWKDKPMWSSIICMEDLRVASAYELWVLPKEGGDEKLKQQK